MHSVGSLVQAGQGWWRDRGPSSLGVLRASTGSPQELAAGCWLQCQKQRAEKGQSPEWDTV